MGQIEKGVILTIEGPNDRNGNKTRARVQSMNALGTTTLPLTIPWYLRGSMGDLSKGTEVVYSLFDDATGVILSRMDGNWEGKMEETSLVLTVAGIVADTVQTVSVQAETVNASTVTDSGVRLSTHTHSGVTIGESNTGNPVV